VIKYSNLALSDPEKRVLSDFSKVWKVTYNPKPDIPCEISGKYTYKKRFFYQFIGGFGDITKIVHPVGLIEACLLFGG
jgi:hypothetical protein